jgi:DNA-binding Lrp family transcriptional regulator
MMMSSVTGGMAMVRAFVLIQTEVGQSGRVAKEVGAIEGISSAVAVTGPYDVIAVVEAASIDALGKMVVSRIQEVKGIARTLTCPVVHI